MTAKLKSPDIQAHGAIGGRLTDKQIDAYALQGRYGIAKQKEYCKLVESGKLKYLDYAIKKQKLGMPAYQAWKARKKATRKRKPSVKEAANQALRDLGFGHLIDK